MITNMTIIRGLMGTDIKEGRCDWYTPFEAYALTQYKQFRAFVKYCTAVGIELPERIVFEMPYEQWLDAEVTDDDVKALLKAKKELTDMLYKG